MPVLVFILIFKLPDAAMGFMVKPFWVDAGFSAAQIGLVSVNIGLGLSIAGGIVGGWITDRIGIFTRLWILGLVQAASNLGYWIAASMLPLAAPGARVPVEHQAILYAASATESFTGGLGTAAFLAFLMAIVREGARRDRVRAAVVGVRAVALGRRLGRAAWARSRWATRTGSCSRSSSRLPAYLLLPWVRRMLDRGEATTGRRRREPRLECVRYWLAVTPPST